MIGIFVIDDHPIVAQGVTAVLAEAADLVFVGSAATLAEGLTAVATSGPDVVLLDVRLPDTDPVTAVEALRRALPQARIVLFTADPTHPHIRGARAAGAVATVAKDAGPESLRAVLRQVVAGVPTRDDAEPGLLTPRQHDVLTRVAMGMTGTEIAAELKLRPTTVKAYWQETMQRLGVRNRAEAIAAAYHRGLL